MKQKEIQVGGEYRVRVGAHLVKVKVLEAVERFAYGRGCWGDARGRVLVRFRCKRLDNGAVLPKLRPAAAFHPIDNGRPRVAVPPGKGDAPRPGAIQIEEPVRLADQLANRAPCERQVEETEDDFYRRATGHTHGELLAAFNRVAGDDWRGPIVAAVRATDEELALIKKAVEFFTATVAEVTPLNPGEYGIKATGYRAGPAGDH